MRPYTLTFVGGPEDGRRVATRPARDIYKVALLPKLPTYVPVEEEEIAPLNLEEFTYRITSLPGDEWVAYPIEWDDDCNEPPYYKIVRALTRGYVGRS